MNIQVSQQTFSVSIKPNTKTKVTTISGGIQVPANFGDLSNFDESNIQNNGIIMYDASIQKYVIVSPDDVLLKSVSDQSLPTEFTDQLDVDLDNRINLDAGSF